MPYNANSELPSSVRDALPADGRTMFRRVVNSQLDDGLSESRAFASAWSALKRAGWTKGEGGKWTKKEDKTKTGPATGVAKEEALSKSTYCEVLKVDEGEGIVYGWGIISKLQGKDYFDTDNEHFPEKEMRKAATSFMEGQRINNNDHISGDEGDVGIVVHSFPLTQEIAKAMGVESAVYGWMVGVKPDEDTLQKFKSGEYTGFSIEGGGEPIDLEDN